MLPRDFDWEEKHGLCSYCGRVLPITEAPNGDLITCTCPACDEYDNYGRFDDMDDLYPDDDLYEGEFE